MLETLEPLEIPELPEGYFFKVERNISKKDEVYYSVALRSTHVEDTINHVNGREIFAKKLMKQSGSLFSRKFTPLPLTKTVIEEGMLSVIESMSWHKKFKAFAESKIPKPVEKSLEFTPAEMMYLGRQPH